jgi:hypothetical protein
MLYVCPRCSYETSVAKYMKSHCNRKTKCENINNYFDNDDVDLYENIVFKTITESRKILKRSENKFECPQCFRLFTCHSSAYRHLMTCKTKPNESECDSYFRTNIQNNFNEYHQNNFIGGVNNIIETQNNYFIFNQVVNPFENEDLSHIDKTLILEIIVHDNSNIFSRIHTELIKNPTNYNIFIESSKSRKVSVFTDENKIEKKNTIDALSLRIKSIYDKTKIIIKNIYEKCPHILSEIYDTDSAKFNCLRNETLKIFNTLNEIIDYRYIQYNKKPESVDDTINQNRANLKLVMDLIEIRGATKNLFLCIK